MRWSLSSLGTFEKCPAKYDYKYQKKLQEVRSASASRGVDSHRAVEQFLKNEVAELPTEINFYTNFLQGLKEHEIYPEHTITLNAKWEPESVEENIWYKGVLDLKLVNPDELVVYDWKTGKVYPDHDDQKTLYSVAAFAEHPAVFNVRAVHVYLDLGINREKTFHRDQMPELRKRWEDRVGVLERTTDFIANPGFHCRYCGYSKTRGGPCRF